MALPSKPVFFPQAISFAKERASFEPRGLTAAAQFPYPQKGLKYAMPLLKGIHSSSFSYSLISARSAIGKKTKNVMMSMSGMASVAIIMNAMTQTGM